jgi:hypothetical protein
MANDTEFGLVAYVFGPEQDATRTALRLDVGMVAVNRGVLSDPAAPFGGTKQSGLGREGSSEGRGRAPAALHCDPYTRRGHAAPSSKEPVGHDQSGRGATAEG